MLQPRDIVISSPGGVGAKDTTANLAGIVVQSPLTVMPDTTLTVVFIGGRVMRVLAKFLEPLEVTPDVRQELLLEFLAAREVMR